MAKYLSLEGLTYFWGKVKEWVETKLSTKANLASPQFSGTPTAPTAEPGTDTTQLATTAFVKAAVQAANPDLASYFEDVAYDSDGKKIQFKNGGKTVKELDATPFIKDGMVSTVAIVDGSGDNTGKKVLKITFNTDAGLDAIEIPLEGIFNASNYYTKNDVDEKLEGYVETETLDETLVDYVKSTDLVAVTNPEIDGLFTE